MPDYIPRDDAGFDTWQSNFATYVNAHLAAIGLPTGIPGDPDVDEMNTERTDWATKYSAHTAAQAAAQAARSAKDASKGALVQTIRLGVAAPSKIGGVLNDGLRDSVRSPSLAAG